MKLSITGKHMSVPEQYKDYITERIERFNKIEAQLKEVHVVLAVEKYRNIAEIVLKVDGTVLNSKEETEDMYVSIEHAVEKISRQLVKYKGKVRENKHKKEDNIKVLSGAGLDDDDDMDDIDYSE